MTVIESGKIKQAVANLMLDISKNLVYRSVIVTIEGEIRLEHGKLYGASTGMTLRVLNDGDETVGLLKSSEVKEATVAKLVSNSAEIEPGMRVEEIK